MIIGRGHTGRNQLGLIQSSCITKSTGGMPEGITRTGIGPEEDPLGSPGELLWFRVGAADMGDGGRCGGKDRG